MSKWVMQAHFRHLSFNMISMIQRTLWIDRFWPLQSRSEDLGVHLGLQFPQWEFTWECEGSCHHTLCTPKSMWCDSRAPFWPATLQTLALVASPRLGLRQFFKPNGKNLHWYKQFFPWGSIPQNVVLTLSPHLDGN